MVSGPWSDGFGLTLAAGWTTEDAPTRQIGNCPRWPGLLPTLTSWPSHRLQVGASHELGAKAPMALVRVRFPQFGSGPEPYHPADSML